MRDQKVDVILNGARGQQNPGDFLEDPANVRMKVITHAIVYESFPVFRGEDEVNKNRGE